MRDLEVIGVQETDKLEEGNKVVADGDAQGVARRGGCDGIALRAVGEAVALFRDDAGSPEPVPALPLCGRRIAEPVIEDRRGGAQDNNVGRNFLLADSEDHISHVVAIKKSTSALHHCFQVGLPTVALPAGLSHLEVLAPAGVPFPPLRPFRMLLPPKQVTRALPRWLGLPEAGLPPAGLMDDLPGDCMLLRFDEPVPLLFEACREV
eukprot:CAMPEP_0180581454 /NCGR_PEP_ID=MMETSP1037_2-20121125/14059_1 /TAXON_ID=632150 /ORGANISM="Azadinium spinosum, Strain 3D9" /LENGTH=206 /DNA_ID=CAMNT_0022599435 /DNA_START=112 /DNA_END=729 /DNA_ORIENTATION=-